MGHIIKNLQNERMKNMHVLIAAAIGGGLGVLANLLGL
jgi:hypothetical protein